MEFSLEHLQPKERASFALRSLYETAGCRKYHMGRFEEYSLYQENRSFLSSEQVITFTDLDGRLLALKPDVTLSIAKTAQPAPGETLRYYYHENVYRPSAESHTFKEISQMGLELLGAVGEAEVQQAVCLAAQSLAALGAEWVLEVSHMGYLFGLFDALGVPEAARAQLLEKLRQKNAHELRAAALSAGLSETAADTLCGVLELSGSYAATLSKAAALCRNPAMTAAVAELTALAPTLGQAGGSIRLDLTLAGEMEYYNGLVFQGYLKALPRPLLKGGRYDLLLQKFTPGAVIVRAGVAIIHKEYRVREVVLFGVFQKDGLLVLNGQAFAEPCVLLRQPAVKCGDLIRCSRHCCVLLTLWSNCQYRIGYRVKYSRIGRSCHSSAPSSSNFCWAFLATMRSSFFKKDSLPS